MGVRVADVDRNKKKKEKIRKKNKKKKNKKKKVPSPVISYKVSSKRFQQLKAAMVNKGEKDILRPQLTFMANGRPHSPTVLLPSSSSRFSTPYKSSPSSSPQSSKVWSLS